MAVPEAGDGRLAAPMRWSQAVSVLRVAVPSPLRRCFDYLPPEHTVCGAVPPGVRVRVPFGRGSCIGVVLESDVPSRLEADRLRRVEAVLDAVPLLDAELLALLRWVAGYYHHPIGEVVHTALPVTLRRAGRPQTVTQRHWHVTAAGRAPDEAHLARAPRQREALSVLSAGGPLGTTRAQLEAAAPGSAATLDALARRGWVCATEAVAALLPAPAEGPTRAPELSGEQTRAVEMADACHQRFEALLLDGITGSGKTEVYLELARRCLARGRQVLLLVPEIGLTPQFVERLRRRLGVPLALLHSGLADGARAGAWLAAGEGRVEVVLGTRSAVFTPMPRLGLVVVDEEHDGSYKQGEGLRYSARDLALLRARARGVPVVLGSATPSLETLWNVQRGRFRSVRLEQRAGAATPPSLEVVDLRARSAGGHLSATLVEAMQAALAGDEQVLLFVNRRGYAPTLLCHTCGALAECPRCDARLVVHRASARLRCHHCGLERPLPVRCPDCGGEQLRPVGLGTERIEAELAERFPAVPMVRIDRDTTRRRGALEAQLAGARSGATRILLGTQMLAKGHHFPGVTLVGILDADGGLLSADFRASERMAQLIVQVAGRAGRAERKGRVLIQTHQPDHPLLVALLTGSYRDFARAALDERRAAALPPVSAMALLRAEAPAPAAARAFLEAAALAARELTAPDVAVLGPVPAPMERRQGRYRAQLLLQADARAALQAMLSRWVPVVEGLPEARRVRWSLDVDPQHLA